MIADRWEEEEGKILLHSCLLDSQLGRVSKEHVVKIAAGLHITMLSRHVASGIETGAR